MMNFRYELNKIREEKVNPSINKEEIILRQVISYYEHQDATEVMEAKEINFCIDAQNNIIGRIYDMDEEVARDFSVAQSFASREEAEKVLWNLEYKFRLQDYKIMYGKSAAKDGQFSVLIV